MSKVSFRKRFFVHIRKGAFKSFGSTPPMSTHSPRSFAFFAFIAPKYVSWETGFDVERLLLWHWLGDQRRGLARYRNAVLSDCMNGLLFFVKCPDLFYIPWGFFGVFCCYEIPIFCVRMNNRRWRRNQEESVLIKPK